MSSACAWCKGPMSAESAGRGVVSHGVCDACLVDLEYRRQPFNSFLNALSAAVMAVDGDGRVLDGNPQFLNLVGKTGSAVVDRLGGEVISCIYSSLPGGCGQTEHCVGCTIRGAVNETKATNQPCVSIPTFAYVRTPDGQVSRLEMLVTTEPVGNLVLLRIDEAAFSMPAAKLN